MEAINNNLSIRETCSNDILVIEVKIHGYGLNVGSSFKRKLAKVF